MYNRPRDCLAICPRTDEPASVHNPRKVCKVIVVAAYCFPGRSFSRIFDRSESGVRDPDVGVQKLGRSHGSGPRHLDLAVCDVCVPVLSALNDNGVNVRPDQHRGLEMVVDCLLLFRITPTTGDVGGSKMANDDVLAASAHG